MNPIEKAKQLIKDNNIQVASSIASDCVKKLKAVRLGDLPDLTLLATKEFIPDRYKKKLVKVALRQDAEIKQLIGYWSAVLAECSKAKQ